jgi:PhnB protein
MQSHSAGIPANSSVIMPRLFCRDPDAAIDFYLRGLGANELGRRPGPDGRTAHALLMLGPAMFMVEAEWPSLPSRAPNPDGSSPVVIFVYVEDVDGLVQRATASGARVLIPATNQFWGDRTAWIIDPVGHVWTIASRIEETTEGERDARWSDILAGQ